MWSASAFYSHHFLSPFCGFLPVEHSLLTSFIKPINIWHWLLLHIWSRLTLDVCFPLWQENLPFPACNPLFLCCSLYFSKSLRHRFNVCLLNVQQILYTVLIVLSVEIMNSQHNRCAWKRHHICIDTSNRFQHGSYYKERCDLICSYSFCSLD